MTSEATRPHPGDCPHVPDERLELASPGEAGEKVWIECQECGLKGRPCGSTNRARYSFSEAIRRERMRRRADLELERDRLERLMTGPPAGTRLLRGRTF